MSGYAEMKMFERMKEKNGFVLLSKVYKCKNKLGKNAGVETFENSIFSRSDRNVLLASKTRTLTY